MDRGCSNFSLWNLAATGVCLLRACRESIATCLILVCCLTHPLLDTGAASVATVAIAICLPIDNAFTLFWARAAPIATSSLRGVESRELFRLRFLASRAFVSSACAVGRHLAIGRQRTTAESELLDNTAADTFTLPDKGLESIKCRAEVTAASA